MVVVGLVCTFGGEKVMFNDGGGVARPLNSKILSCDWSMRISLVILLGSH